MTSSKLWKALQEQALAWSKTPVFERFASALPRNAASRSQGLSGALQSYDATGAQIGARPLRSASRIRTYGDLMPDLDKELNVLVQGWLTDAQRVEEAHRRSIAWLRSRLPGYPTMPVPQLIRDTHLTTPEFTWRLAWSRADLAGGLQFQELPLRTAALLGASKDQEKRLNLAAQTVCAELEATDEWVTFAKLSNHLESDSREQLGAARDLARQKLKPEKVDAHEPHLALPRDTYRQEAMSEVIQGLSGLAREYVDAFQSVDTMIEVTASDVFGQLASYGSPQRLSRIRDIEFEPGTPPRVHFTLDDEVLPEVGLLAWAEDVLLNDALLVDEANFSFDQGTGSELRLSAMILKGSGTAWREALEQ